MQFYFRTSENSGIGVGPIGATFLAMVYIVGLVIVVALAAIYFLAYLLVAGVRAALARRG